MNLLKKLKSLFQKSEGADFKEPVKPGREKLKRNVGKEVFEKTGKIKTKEDKPASVKNKIKKKPRSANRTKSSIKAKSDDTNNRSAIKKRENVVKYNKKKVAMNKSANTNKAKAKASRTTTSKKKSE